MSELNEHQKEIVEQTEGFVVVDAGPGTGKTHTVVERYVNMVKKGINPMDMLMVTFTRNAAGEMGDRIRNKMSALGMENVNDVRTTTFDSYCLNVVLNYPDSVSDFFEIKRVLSRKAKLVENETLNREHFQRFFDGFMLEHGHRYVRDGSNYSALASKYALDYYALINKLMSRGIIPKRYEWFSEGEKMLYGDVDSIVDALITGKDDVVKGFGKKLKEKDYHADFPVGEDGTIDLEAAAPIAAGDEGRFMHLELIRDLYFAYIVKSITDNRLTFALTAVFAFVALYTEERARKTHSVKYLTVDEFQDTNELQLMMCLLLLNEPNLCVVGDWKQGIYGFRFVSIENITNFGSRVSRFARMLNKDGVKRIPFPVPEEVFEMSLTVNYRSSDTVLKGVFQTLDAKGSKDDDPLKGRGKITRLTSAVSEGMGEYTALEKIEADTWEEECSMVMDKVHEYVNSGKYKVFDRGKFREPNYGDVAILCRTVKKCTAIRDFAEKSGIPAFLQGDIDVMGSREGKLALAWLRYVNNPTDPLGYSAILADMGVPLNVIKPIRDGKAEMPSAIVAQRESLLGKRRRPNDLLTSIFAFYGLENDMTQSIISILSGAYGNTLLTISDLIRIIEKDIEAGTGYSVDLPLENDAVTVQTIHKSKGLEYPFVILAGIGLHNFPLVQRDTESVQYSDRLGVRATKRHVSRDGMEMILQDWKTMLAKMAVDTDYSEERRLFFVGLSRAKQYITISKSGDKASHFFNAVDGEVCQPPKIPLGGGAKRARVATVEPPSITKYEPRIKSVAAHDIMGTLPAEEVGEDGKGAEYGTAVHKAAELVAAGLDPDADYPELERIKSIVEGLGDAELKPEVSCVLPVDGVAVRGIIDLLAIYPDRVEIRDWKTDSHMRYRPLYEVQLSVYYHAAQCFGKKVECFLEYVSLGETVKVEPLPMAKLSEALENYMSGVKPDAGDVEI